MLKVVGETLQVGEMKNEYKKGLEKAGKETFREKRLHRKFMRDLSEVAVEILW